MMKIKHERQVRLDELIKRIMNQEFEKDQQIQFTAKNDKPNDSMILFYERGGGIFGNFFTNSYNLNDLYTITEEVEIDYDTRLDLIAVRKAGTVSRFENRSIQGVLAHFNIRLEVEVDYIYIQNEDGSIGEMVWSKERGLNATNTEI